MDWARKHSTILISIAIAILALFGIQATFVVEEDSTSPAIVETSTDIEVGEITIIEPEE